MAMNKIFHIVRRGQTLCEIACLYNKKIIDICNDNGFTNIDSIKTGDIIIINVESRCNIDNQLYCNVEKRGCHGCFYIE